jgi:hypothetical protein
MNICNYHKCSRCPNEVWVYVQAEVYCAKCKRPMKKTRSSSEEQHTAAKVAA